MSRDRSTRLPPAASASRAGRRRRSCSFASQRRGWGTWSSCATTGSSTRSSPARCDAGLIIHESRFTYGEHGLVSVADLGEWWEGETGLPVPLAGIFARSDLEPELVDAAEAAIRASVEYAFANPEASRDYVRSLSHEMTDEVCAAHIALYVNASSVDIGDEGLAAIDRLLGRAAAAA